MDLCDPSLVLKPDTRADIPAPMLEQITEALSSSIVHTFVWAIIPAVIALLAAWFMSKEKFDPASKSDEYLASH
ncbi:hypothetical protein AMS66_18255 [Paenibacillus xylanivorans]|uniref:Uncharacterized protein n=2 Tax=Paenibacillus xylanivorans TaxID=1705561 RepID=A0A0N0C425_9BACL|nr:hypothetical protein AMS66_18255 [Paenibacillus xylanivorans]